jgi:hypothetical protein
MRGFEAGRRSVTICIRYLVESWVERYIAAVTPAQAIAPVLKTGRLEPSEAPVPNERPEWASDG